MKKVLTILIIIFSTSFACAQNNNLLNKAYNFYTEGNLVDAKNVIDSAAENELYQAQILTWYLKGFIYKDLFKQNINDENLRREAVSSFSKLLSLDTAQKYSNESKQNLKYLASTYYNAAMNAIASSNYELAEENYEKFEQTLQLSGEKLSVDNKQKFLLALGSALVQQYRKDTAKNYYDRALKTFEAVLALDSLNKSANYNLGVLYYNEAVNIILEADFDEVDILAISEFEDKSIALFEQSLPYMQRAYMVDPKDKNILEGLAGIYFGLKDFEASNKYKAELEALSD